MPGIWRMRSQRYRTQSQGCDPQRGSVPLHLNVWSTQGSTLKTLGVPTLLENQENTDSFWIFSTGSFRGDTEESGEREKYLYKLEQILGAGPDLQRGHRVGR